MAWGRAGGGGGGGGIGVGRTRARQRPPTPCLLGVLDDDARFLGGASPRRPPLQRRRLRGGVVARDELGCAEHVARAPPAQDLRGASRGPAPAGAGAAARTAASERFTTALQKRKGPDRASPLRTRSSYLCRQAAMYAISARDRPRSSASAFAKLLSGEPGAGTANVRTLFSTKDRVIRAKRGERSSRAAAPPPPLASPHHRVATTPMTRTATAPEKSLAFRRRRVARAAGGSPPNKPEAAPWRAGGGPAIPRAVFGRLAREVAQGCGTDPRFEGAAISALHDASEQTLVALFAAARRLAEHAGRTTIEPEDLALARRFILASPAGRVGGGPVDVPREAMKRFVREIAQACKADLCFEGAAMTAILGAAEDHLRDVFYWSIRLAAHAGRRTAEPEDMRLARLLLDTARSATNFK